MMHRELYREAVRRVARLRFEREHVTDGETLRRIERELANAEAALATQEAAASVRPINGGARPRDIADA